MPPTSYCGGWVCFIISLVLIGCVTAVIGDLAELFGCVLEVPDAVTAIVFVALGTSMPDLFASQRSAIQDPTADASIVNVTGSNSVNVFLGLGLPWTMGSIYWLAKEESREWQERYPEVAARENNSPTFVVPSGNLGFSVLVFTCCSFAALLILNLRRRLIGAELGGPFRVKLITAAALVIFWICFIILSSWQVLRDHKASSGERWSMIMVVVICSVLATIGAVISMVREARTRDEQEAKEAAIRAQEAKTSSGPAELFSDSLQLRSMSNLDGEECGQTWKQGESEGTEQMADDADNLVVVASPDAAAGPTSAVIGATSLSAAASPLPPMVLSVESAAELETQPPEPHYDVELEVNAMDFSPVQPLPTPSVPPLMSLEEPTNAQPSLGQLHAQTLSLWNSNNGSPIVHLPNATRDALLIGQHEVSRRWQTSSSASPATPTRHQL